MNFSAGPASAKLWIIADMPSVDEMSSNVPFTGAPARYITQKMANVKYPGDFFYCTLIPTRPPGGNFELIEGDSQKLAALMRTLQELKDLAREHKPNIILCLGDKVLKYLMARTNISDWRGHIVWSDEFDCKIMATYHPSSALRQRFADKSDKPGQWDILCQTDLGKAIGESFSPALVRPEATVLIAKDYATQMRELEKFHSASALAFDIETDGFCITCISFASSRNYSVCIPLRNVYPGKVVVNILPQEQQMDVWMGIKRLLESPIPKIAQNSQFDMTVLQMFYSIRVQNLIWDTMVAAHNLYCDLPKDLGTLISLYSEHPYHKHQFGSGDLESFWDYNAKDSLVTFDIYLSQVKEAEELGVLEHYQHITNPLIRCLVDIQCMGVKVDLPMRDAAVAREKQVADCMLKGIQSVLAGLFPEGFNPNSPLQMKKLFYEILKTKIIYNKGVPTTDANAREEFKERFKTKLPIVCKIIDAIDKYLKARHLVSVLGQDLLRGRLHTAYDVTGTNTGRLNSRESIFGTGGNLQNLQAGPPRQMLIPG